MPRDKELIGTYTGRPESPEIEMLAQESIGEAISSLITEKGLYQKADLTFDKMEEYLKSIGRNNIAYFKKEFSKRPWVPITPDLSKENYMRAQFFCGVGDGPLGMPTDEMKLTFPLPSVKMYCDSCKDEHTYSSIGVLWTDGFMNHYPKISERTEQLFNWHYVCSICKTHVIGFLVKREGIRLTLCGRTERLHINVPKVIPKKLRNIIEDAIGSANENDIYAGFYHLRTFCEHYMKGILELPISDKMTGDDLSSKYNASLDSRMKSGIPSMAAIYELTSKLMHERSGERGDFDALLSDIEGHLSAKDLFIKYSNK